MSRDNKSGIKSNSKKEFFIRLRELILTKETFAAIIGGLIAGSIGFIAAVGVNSIQHKHEIKDQRNSAVVELHREISENRFLLEAQLRKKSVKTSKLATVIWDTKKYIIDFDKKYLMEGISVTYDTISRYNEICDLISYRIKDKELKTNDITVQKNLYSIIKKLIGDLRALELLTFQDLVKKKLAKSKDWDEEKMEAWDREVLIPGIKSEVQSPEPTVLN